MLAHLGHSDADAQGATKGLGLFRSTRGGTAFGRIRSYLSTLRKQGIQRLAALESLFSGQLLSPSLG